MTELSVDLYGHYQIPSPQDAEGELTCYLHHTPKEVSANRTRPALLLLPGGAYWYASPREAEPVALRFAAKGYAVFVLRYSCTPHRFPVALREAAMAMRYIRENARTFEVDPNMVAAMGFSAGGHLCGTLGMLYDCPEVADIGTAQQLRPDALGLCYPVAVSWGRTHDGSFDNLCGDDTALRQRLSLEKLVRPDMPPAFLWHTRSDQSVPCRNSLLLATAMEEAGVDFALHIYRQGQHGLSTADEMVYPAHSVPQVSWDVPGWVEAAAAFFREKGFCIRDVAGE